MMALINPITITPDNLSLSPVNSVIGLPSSLSFRKLPVIIRTTKGQSLRSKNFVSLRISLAAIWHLIRWRAQLSGWHRSKFGGIADAAPYLRCNRKCTSISNLRLI